MNSSTKVGDVALFKIEPEDDEEAYRDTHPISKMDLIPDGVDVTGKNCDVSGWGRLTEGGQTPRMLQVTNAIQFN